MNQYINSIVSIIKNNRNFLFKINRRFHLFLFKKNGNTHPLSIPYLSGDNLRSLAKHQYDNIDSRFLPELVIDNDLVFVASPMIKYFLESIHPQIQARYILITHNGDENIDEHYLKYIDDRIIKWFAQNANVYHPKLFPLPIGLENLSYYNNGIINYFSQERKKTRPKKDRILFGFNIATNREERSPAFTCLSKNDQADQIIGWPTPRKYLKLLSGYRFVASPPGNGLDCIRTWEALYVRTIPIVKRSYLTEYFFNLGLPLWIIDDWHELDNLSREQIAKKYCELWSGFDDQILFFDYWKDKIVN
ncbi:MAG: hypothetical protein WC564_04535 [Patescibacteria group bacterium]